MKLYYATRSLGSFKILVYQLHIFDRRSLYLGTISIYGHGPPSVYSCLLTDNSREVFYLKRFSSANKLSMGSYLT